MPTSLYAACENEHENLGVNKQYPRNSVVHTSSVPTAMTAASAGSTSSLGSRTSMTSRSPAAIANVVVSSTYRRKWGHGQGQGEGQGQGQGQGQGWSGLGLGKGMAKATYPAPRHNGIMCSNCACATWTPGGLARELERQRRRWVRHGASVPNGTAAHRCWSRPT